MIRLNSFKTAALVIFCGLLLAPAVRAYDEFRGFSQAELDQMLAPVALYPDTVLSHVLIAATYPLEVVQAARWTRNNERLRGDQAVNAVIGQEWDPSVMALVAFPDLLARMDADLDWTQRLGDAFLIQEGEVLDSIQRLRAQAHHAGHLRSNEHVQVVREREVIYIEPARRQVIYVPYYDPRVVYGHWSWAHHPPIFWHHPPRHRRSVVFFWGPAYHVPPSFFFSSFHWSHRQVVVVHHHHHFYRPHHPRPRTVVHQHFYSGRDIARHDGAQRWQHEPTHRRGVAYRPGVDDRHRQIEQRRSSSVTASAPAAPVRLAESRSQQRQWAETRRSEPALLQSSGSRPGTRASASAASNRTTSGRATARRAEASTMTASQRAASPARPEASLRTQGSAESGRPQSAPNLASSIRAASSSRPSARARATVEPPRETSRTLRTSPASSASRPTADRQARSRSEQAARITSPTAPGRATSGRTAPAPRAPVAEPRLSARPQATAPARSSERAAPRSPVSRESSSRVERASPPPSRSAPRIESRPNRQAESRPSRRVD